MDLKKRKKFSFIYKNIRIYRFVMNILYSGRYYQRFKIIENLLNPNNDKTIVELCFGDIILAEWCKKNRIKWIGFDINEKFISNAKTQGYDAHYKDLLELKDFPKSDVVIIMGSLYQFNNILEGLINNVMNSTSKFIISEPINNLATNNGIIGYFARRSTKVGKGDEIFRYNYENLHHALKKSCEGKFVISEIKRTPKDLILLIKKK